MSYEEQEKLLNEEPSDQGIPSFDRFNKKKNKLNVQEWIENLKWYMKKINFSWWKILVSILWILFILSWYFVYSDDVLWKREKIPTLQKEIEILKDNIKLQKAEKKALEDFWTDTTLLDLKKEIISKHLYEWDKDIVLNHLNEIYQISWEVWFNIDSITIDEPKNTDTEINKFWKFIPDNIENFVWDTVWFNTYNITTKVSEETVMRFKEKIESRLSFSYSDFSLKKAENDITYDFKLYWFYLVTEDKTWTE